MEICYSSESSDDVNRPPKVWKGIGGGSSESKDDHKAW